MPVLTLKRLRTEWFARVETSANHSVETTGGTLLECINRFEQLGYGYYRLVVVFAKQMTEEERAVLSNISYTVISSL